MELQLRVGGKYRTRDGKEVVTIINELAENPYPFVGDSGFSYRRSGAWYVPYGDTEHDLVEEVRVAPASQLNDLVHTMQPPQAVTCYVILRDTPDIVVLPSNTYSSILKCGTLEVLTADEEESQVALFAPNSWVAYVNKEPVND